MDDRKKDKGHYNRTPVRKAEFITPPNALKAKVGTGGLSEDILNKAEALLENNNMDFVPLADIYMTRLLRAVEAARAANPDMSRDENEAIISAMLYPSMQLKANGSMFRYQMITKIADKLIHFLEVITRADNDSLEIVTAFHTTMRAVILGRITGDGGRHGSELIRALDEACVRYLERTPTRGDLDYSYINTV